MFEQQVRETVYAAIDALDGADEDLTNAITDALVAKGLVPPDRIWERISTALAHLECNDPAQAAAVLRSAVNGTG